MNPHHRAKIPASQVPPKWAMSLLTGILCVFMSARLLSKPLCLRSLHPPLGAGREHLWGSHLWRHQQQLRLCHIRVALKNRRGQTFMPDNPKKCEMQAGGVKCLLFTVNPTDSRGTAEDLSHKRGAHWSNMQRAQRNTNLSI